jgi:MSHA biogenesis protein MshO
VDARRRPPAAPVTGRGFTLVELVVTIAVSAVVVSFMAMFMVIPTTAYTAGARRADLVDAADSALRFMSRDLRKALPNSVRIGTSGSVTALELLASVDGARYRDGGPLANPNQELDFAAADGAFATTVPFGYIGLPFSSNTHYLAIYNVGVPGADAYSMSNVITPAGTQVNVAAGGTPNENLVTLSPAFRFAWPSPGKRVYLVSGPVTYLCDTTAGTLTRYSGYTVTASQPVTDAALVGAGATAARVAGDVASCQFTYTAGTAARTGLATLALQIARSGERVQLLHQVQMVNAP